MAQRVGWLVLWLAACGPSVLGEQGDASGPCGEGETRCVGLDLETCTGGEFTLTTSCPQVCDPELGCVVCQPGTGTCSGDVSHACLPDGSGYADVYCDPVQGVSCNPTAGVCEGACAPASLGRSYIGCEYYPTVTGNMVSDTFAFAVAVANTTGVQADITIEEGALTAPLTFSVAPGSVVVRTLPWQYALKLCTGAMIQNGCPHPPAPAALAAKGAFHLRSTSPVTVYQFSPLDYYSAAAADYSYTNDASLLLPTNAWGQSFVIASWPRLDASHPTNGDTWPGLLAVTAGADGTNVTLTTTVNTFAGQGAPAFAAGVPQSVALARGDVLEVAAPGTLGVVPLDDLTGSTLTADRPVQVIGGHYCAYVPGDLAIGYCDHLEESVFPIETLSDRYLVVAPAVPSLPDGKERMVRIVATQPNTELTFDPPLGGVGTTIANTGGFVEVARQTASFQVSANHKILVAQYMEGQVAGGNTGDPAMAFEVATDQYRQEYLFHAPTNYEVNYVSVTAPVGAVVTVDGVEVTGYTPIGSSGYQLARVALTAGVDGNHTASGTEPFGISVYGYGQYTSYWYPGGLDLDVIPIE
jgi:hypothetical protein